MCLANRTANFGDFGGNLLRPFGMLLRLPAEIENAVGIFGYVTAGVRLRSDGYERIIGRPQMGTSTLGKSEPIRLPLPAARMIASGSRMIRQRLRAFQ